jgi:hypothetical protein
MGSQEGESIIDIRLSQPEEAARVVLPHGNDGSREVETSSGNLSPK